MDEPALNDHTSIIVPVYNSAATLRELYGRISAAVRGIPAEIVFVDDASADRSWEVIGRLAAEDPRVRGIRLDENVGQHRATLAAIAVLGGRRIVTLDDDLQHPPESIPALLGALDGGADAAIAQHGSTRTHSSWRRLVSFLLNPLFTLLLKKPHGLRLAAFRAIDGEVAAELVRLRIPLPVISPMLFRVTGKVVGVDIPSGPSPLKSRYSIRALAVIGLAYLYCSDRRRLLSAALGAIGIGAAAIAAGPLLTSGVASWVLAALGGLLVLLGLLCGGVLWRLRRAERKPASHPTPVEKTGG